MKVEAALPDRAELRRRLIAERAAFVAAPAHAAAHDALTTALCDALADLEPTCLGIYAPLRFEFNVRLAVAADARLAEIARALPYARRVAKAMEYRLVDATTASIADECGIASSDGVRVDPDVVVVPCVGFTADAYRLGYGGGYFDRWLGSHRSVTAVGVAWSFAELGRDAFMPQAHDVPLAFVVTERGVR